MPYGWIKERTEILIENLGWRKKEKKLQRNENGKIKFLEEKNMIG